jgi:hypothetical protein
MGATKFSDLNTRPLVLTRHWLLPLDHDVVFLHCLADPNISARSNGKEGAWEGQKKMRVGEEGAWVPNAERTWFFGFRLSLRSKIIFGYMVAYTARPRYCTTVQYSAIQGALGLGGSRESRRRLMEESGPMGRTAWEFVGT